MSDKPRSFTVGPDEKATPVMVYTTSGMAWGSVVTKELVRVNTFIRTLTPDYVSLYDARYMAISGGGVVQPLASAELHFRTPAIIGFHLMPPAQEPLDYDAGEANRKMLPVTVMVGPFRVDASARISAAGTLAKFLEISTEPLMSLYDASISCPIMPSIGAVRAPLVLIRRDVTVFGAKM